LLNLGQEALFRGIPIAAVTLGFARARARMVVAQEVGLDRILEEAQDKEDDEVSI